MIIADAIITNIVYRLIRGVRTNITPTSINHRIPNIIKRMITDIFIVAAKLVIFSFICKIGKVNFVILLRLIRYCREIFFNSDKHFCFCCVIRKE